MTQYLPRNLNWSEFGNATATDDEIIFVCVGLTSLWMILLTWSWGKDFFIERVWKVHFTENEIILRHFFHTTRYSAESIKMISLLHAPKSKDQNRVDKSDFQDKWYIQFLLKGNQKLNFIADPGGPYFNRSAYVVLLTRTVVAKHEEKDFLEYLYLILKVAYLPHLAGQ